MMYSYKEPLRLDDCSVYYIGYWDSKVTGARVDEHLHGRFYELTVITSGYGKIYTSNETTEVKAGDVYISYPFDFHRIESAPGSIMQYSFISLSISSLKFAEAFESIRSDSNIKEKRLVYDPEILNITKEIITQAGQSDLVFSSEYLSCLIRKMLIRILRGIKYSESNTTIEQDNDICRNIMQYIDDNILSIHDLSEIADHFGYNYSYLSALFKKTTKLTMVFYYRTKRLETAKLLLSNKGFSITRVAEIMNYSSIYSFSKSFKEAYGMSPRKYMELVKKQR